MVNTGWMTTTTLKIIFLIYLSDAVKLNEKFKDYLPVWCSSVPSIPHAVVQRFNIKPSIAQVECNPGYKLVGEKKLTCDNSTWSPVKLPYCKRIKIEDYPPHADAGEDIVIYLPKTSVLLNGSRSTDDNAIVSYHWWNEGPQLVDMRGIYTPYLQLYNLKEGIYIFMLKVEDAMGQQSIDTVKVTVKSASSKACSRPLIDHSTFEWKNYGRTGVLHCINGGYFLHSSRNQIKANSITVHQFNIKCVNGKWTSSDGYGSLPHCFSDMVVKFPACQPPPNIQHGHYYEIPARTDLFLPGTKVKYECNTSYQLLGNVIIECLKDLTWSRHTPICKRSSSIEGTYCPPVSPIPNGQCRCNSKKDLSYCEPIYSSMQIECTCNLGYRIVGNQLLTCTNRGQWSYDQPTCVKVDNVAIDTEGNTSSSTDPTRMNTLAVVIATACSVLGILLLIMIVMIVRKRKPRPRHYHQVGIPPPYTRVHSSSFDELDRVALIGYDAARLPTYEEAVQNNSSSSIQRGQGPLEVQVSSEFRPLPSIPNVVRNNNAQSSDIQSVHSNRHSITTMSTVNRDGISEVFGSIDTVNYSLSDASTSVTVDTLDSATSRPSYGSGTATAGSVNTSQENIVTEDAPLLENDRNVTDNGSVDLEIKDEDKD